MVAGSVFSWVAHHEEFAAASGPQEHTGGIAGKTSSDEAPLRSPRAMYHQGELELELELFILELTQYQDEASEKMRVRFQDCADFPRGGCSAHHHRAYGTLADVRGCLTDNYFAGIAFMIFRISPLDLKYDDAKLQLFSHIKEVCHA